MTTDPQDLPSESHRFDDIHEGGIMTGGGHLVTGIATGFGIGGPTGSPDAPVLNLVVALVYIQGSDEPIQLVMPGDSARDIGQALIEAHQELKHE